MDSIVPMRHQNWGPAGNSGLSGGLPGSSGALQQATAQPAPMPTPYPTQNNAPTAPVASPNVQPHSAAMPVNAPQPGALQQFSGMPYRQPGMPQQQMPQQQMMQRPMPMSLQQMQQPQQRPMLMPQQPMQQGNTGIVPPQMQNSLNTYNNAMGTMNRWQSAADAARVDPRAMQQGALNTFYNFNPR